MTNSTNLISKGLARLMCMKMWLVALLCVMGLQLNAQPKYTLHKYDGSADCGILYGLTSNGKWGIIQNGSSAAGGTARPQVFNTETGRAEDRGNISFSTCSDDANVVVGSYRGMPAAYNHTTKAVTTFPLPKDKLTVAEIVTNPVTGRPEPRVSSYAYVGGHLNAVTADGKYAVGVFLTEYEMCYSAAFVNVETGEVIPTPGLPEYDMTHLDQGQNVFHAITPDGRYIIGTMSDCYLSPASLFTYVYDTVNHTYDVVGFKENDSKPWEKLYPNLFFIDSAVLSGDGSYLVGEAYITEPTTTEGGFGSEYSLPFRYDIKTKEFTVFDSSDLKGKIAYAADGKGTLLIAQGSKGGSGTPMRDFSVLYKDKYPIAFSTICQQYYGFDYQRRVGYENTGTPVGISADGTSFVSFADPQGESYWFHLGAPIEDVCENIDLLGGYIVNPQNGAEFSKMGTVVLSFDRAVEVLGAYDDVTLVNSKGETVAHVASSGFTVSGENPHQVLLQFSTRGTGTVLTPGENYTLVINAGSICVAGDKTLTNKEIRINYKGRADKAVEMVSVTPQAGSELAMLDNVSSFVTLTFDTQILINNASVATLQRKDGTILAYLNTYYSNENGVGRASIFPSSTCYLYAGQEYEVVIKAGCITDLSGSLTSANKEIRIPYTGIYERPVPTDGIIFEDNFDNMAETLNTWMRYDGDKLNPTDEMKSWEFTAVSEPWNFSIRDNEQSTDLCAASHSMYNPAGRSQDVMMTPQLAIPNDDNVTLEFDAQSYRKNKEDRLNVLVWATDAVYGVINDKVFEDMSYDAVPVFSEVLSPGATEGGLDDEWTHYTVNIGKQFKNKNVYIIFYNNNNDQSAIFVNNVKVQREMFYKLQFSNEEMVVAQNDITIKGKFAITMAEASSNVALILLDKDGNTVSRKEFGNCEVDNNMNFEFDALPLTVGAENHYTINIEGGSKKDSYEGVITDLSFRTTKHVALEETTGQDCPNCPLGILTIEKLRRMYGEQIVPVSLHTYTGDQLGYGVGAYGSFLNLVSAPSARIDRVEGIFFPMVSVGTTYYDELEGENLWLTVVKRQLDKLAPADVTLTASIDNDGKVTLQSDVTFALSYDNKQYNVFYVFMEDGIVGHQASNLSAISKQEILGEWCSGGIYATTSVLGYEFEDVARGTLGLSYAGTPGLIPSAIEAGKAYDVTQTCSLPENINDANKVHVAMMLIDAATGQVANCIDAKLVTADGIDNMLESVDSKPVAIYNLQGQRVNTITKAGIYVVGGKKVMIK